MTASELRTLTEESNERLREEALQREEKERLSREKTHRWYVEEYIPKKLGEIHDEMKVLASQGKRFYSVSECEEGCNLLKELLDRDGYATTITFKYVPEYRASGDEYAYSHDAYTQYFLNVTW